jgi:histidyl-tRNA synthetase
MTQFQPIRGVVDQFPESNACWQHIISKLVENVDLMGYKEIKLPILEQTELFLRSVGTQSDIVQKEMYSFEDHGKEHLCLRPEGTAGCMRAYLNQCFREAPFQRFWYYGPMFRRERPQKGRLRQFHQFGLEIIGYDEIMPEIELLLLGHRLFDELIQNSKPVLEINYLGGKESRASYTNALKEYFSTYKNDFDEIHLYRYENNILRLLDTKDDAILKLVKNAPKLSDYITHDDATAFNTMKKIIDQLGIPYVVNERLVRGLDYYSGLVFEWVSDQLGAQGTICAGGRYNGLSNQIGGPDVFATGLSIGIERLVSLVKYDAEQKKAIYLVPDSQEDLIAMPSLVSLLHEEQIPLFSHYCVSQRKKQIKRANKYGAKYIGFVTQEKVEIIDLVQDNESVSLKHNEVKAFYERRLRS